ETLRGLFGLDVRDESVLVLIHINAADLIDRLLNGGHSALRSRFQLSGVAAPGVSLHLHARARPIITVHTATARLARRTRQALRANPFRYSENPFLCLRHQWHAGVRDRANDRTLRRIEEPNTLGAFLRIDDVGVLLLPDRGVRTLELACATRGALR